MSAHLLPDDHWPAIAGAPSATTYIIYIDDSGDETHDLLAALCFPVHRWMEYLQTWKRYRSFVQRELGLPPTVEMHGVEFLRRGVWKAVDAEGGEVHAVAETEKYSSGKQVSRATVFSKALRAIGSFTEARLLTVYQPVPNGVGRLYEDHLLPWLNSWLTVEQSWGVVWYDGTDESLIEQHRAVHRSLPADRRILEDVSHQSSHHSHFIQMADLCAHAAFKSIRGDDRAESREVVTSAYLKAGHLVVPGGFDSQGFPAHSDERGIRNYP